MADLASPAIAPPSRQARHPPGPKGLPVIGHLLEIRRDPLGFFTDCHQQYGDVVGLRFGSWPALLLSGPRDVETVLVENHQRFEKNTFFWRHVTAIFGRGLLTSEGDFWHRQRRLAAPAFAGQRLESYGDIMVRHTSRVVESWQSDAARDFHADMMGLTLGIAAKTLFDAEVEEDVSMMDEAVNTLTDQIAVRFSRPFVIPDAVPLPGHIRYRRALRRVDRIVERIIRERQSDGQDKGDLLSMLMQARDENGDPMPDRQLRDEAVTLLLAGHETTALALSWTVYLLGQHPGVEAQVAAEVAEVVGSRAASVEDLPRLRFTDQVVTEAMRIYPPAWVIGREAVEDCEIGGYPVPTGTTILISPWVIHRASIHFDEPMEFRPDRWSGGLARHLPRFAYLPFGGGPRICIGNRFATMEAVLILATLMQRFRLELQREREVVPFPSITLRPKGGIWVKPIART
jgi:cytochrome P450